MRTHPSGVPISTLRRSELPGSRAQDRLLRRLPEGDEAVSTDFERGYINGARAVRQELELEIQHLEQQLLAAEKRISWLENCQAAKIKDSFFGDFN